MARHKRDYTAEWVPAIILTRAPCSKIQIMTCLCWVQGLLAHVSCYANWEHLFFAETDFNLFNNKIRNY